MLELRVTALGGHAIPTGRFQETDDVDAIDDVKIGGRGG